MARGPGGAGQAVGDGEGEGRSHAERAGGDGNAEPPGVGDSARSALVAGAYHGREAPLPLAFVEPAQRLVHDHLADDLGPGRHVADPLGEEARAVLLEERGGLALGQRALEAPASLLLAGDLADDALVAEHEGEAAHRAVAGQGEQVANLDGLVEGVLETLGQDDAGDAAAGLGREVHALKGKLASVGGDEAPAGALGGRSRAGLCHCSHDHVDPPVVRTVNAGVADPVTEKIRFPRGLAA